MPILNFEYTSNLKIDDKIKSFLSETHEILVQEIKTDLRTCRSSISKINDYVIGDNNPHNAYIILYIKMLPGRNDEIKKYDTQVRVYLTETDKQHYYGLE